MIYKQAVFHFKSYMFLSVFVGYILYMTSNPSYEKQINKKE